MKKLALMAALLLPGAALADIYDCAINKTRPGDWISDKILISHDPATGKVVVNDVVILTLAQRPAEGRVKTDNDRRRTFAWSIEDVRNGTQHAPDLQYTATYQKGSGEVMVSMTPVGYANTFQRYGKCTVRS